MRTAEGLSRLRDTPASKTAGLFATFVSGVRSSTMPDVRYGPPSMVAAGVDGWTVLLAALPVAGALAGAYLTSRWQKNMETGRLSADARRRQYEEHRDVLVALVTTAQQVDARLQGAAVGQAMVEIPEGLTFAAQQVAAELVVGPDTWCRMRPYIELLNVQSNAFSPHVDASTRQQLFKEVATRRSEGPAEPRDQFLSAIRDHLTGLLET